jgi:uncharacterized membrane protein
MAKKGAMKHPYNKKALRLYLSLALGLIVLLVMRNYYSPVVSLMSSWITFSGSYLISSWLIIFFFNPKEVRVLAEKEDASGSLIFLFVVCAAVISLFGVIFLLKSIPDESKRGLSLHILLSFSAIICSWLLVHTLFTLRYAHIYYLHHVYDEFNKQPHNCGIEFPNEKEPDYLDFAYFSFVLGMTFQVSDVIITSKQVRRLALLHGFLSFIYNTVIVAFSINIISGLIAK